MTRDLLVITPTRGRPGSMKRLADAVAATATCLTDLIFAVDDDDPASLATAGEKGAWACGPRDTVSGWTNRLALEHAGRYRALASLSDDHVPRTPGWDRLLLDAIDGMGGTGFAYGDDLLQGANMPTAVVVSSAIVTALGWMALPSCRHYWIDTAWKDLGEGAGCLAYRPDVIIEHCHPGAGKAPWDETYASEAALDAQDKAAYDTWRRDRMAADIATVAAARKGS